MKANIIVQETCLQNIETPKSEFEMFQNMRKTKENTQLPMH